VKRLYLYDDSTARAFEPFALTRPASELRAGAEIIRRRWEKVARTKSYAFIGAPHLANFDEIDGPPALQNETTIPAGSVIANSRFVVSLDAVIDDTSTSFSCDGSVCAVRIRSSIDSEALLDGSASLDALAESSAKPTPIAGRWLREVWDLIGQLGVQLTEDIPLIGSALTGAAIENATIIGRNKVFCETGAGIEPFVVLDATEGPILIRRGATLSAFSRIVGPCYIGEESHIVGDAIRACSIGDVCKVRGEISSSVMLGHSNKGHTGFVGSSYIGRWVNLGAGTTTSNLKNTYGPVQLWTPSGMRDTELQFLGSLIGDHAKAGIGTMLTTGCVVGAGANVYGAHLTPKRIPPFAWGDSEPYDRYDSSKFIEVVERMMARRHVTLGAKARRHIESVYAMSEEASS
jgi:UDP-N-acetylglucosamine diphosphorylase / glucose-1-phosphate thymidylyltransferase / UDP-N-acetylgalactosamine diphosphorylase / glucosamine-1-phosphate N-acetyltransferase / galactosamine-1-phosphate N-acetyltransferase